MTEKYTLVADATAGVVTKINEKRIFYYAFVIYNRSVITEPVPLCEIITDNPQEDTFTFLIRKYLTDVKCLYGQATRNPHSAICDLSWPTMESLLTCLNSESLDEYIERCYRIVIGAARKTDMPTQIVLTFIHMCLSDFMKIISVHTKKVFAKTQRESLIFYFSVLLNQRGLFGFRRVLRDIFTILISSKQNSHLVQSVLALDNNVKKLGNNNLFESKAENKENIADFFEQDDDPRDNSEAIKTSKRSRFYEMSKRFETND